MSGHLAHKQGSRPLYVHPETLRNLEAPIDTREPQCRTAWIIKEWFPTAGGLSDFYMCPYKTTRHASHVPLATTMTHLNLETKVFYINSTMAFEFRSIFYILSRLLYDLMPTFRVRRGDVDVGFRVDIFERMPARRARGLMDVLCGDVSSL